MVGRRFHTDDPGPDGIGQFSTRSDVSLPLPSRYPLQCAARRGVSNIEASKYRYRRTSILDLAKRRVQHFAHAGLAEVDDLR